MTIRQDSVFEDQLPPSDYLTFYTDSLHKALDSVNGQMFNLAVTTLEDAILNNKQIFVCGNGGSAAIAEHLTCDHSKGISTNTKLFPRTISLVSNMSLITAIANDLSYDKIFGQQLVYLGNKGDILIVISSSGNSKNIIEAMEVAKALNMYVIALTGFDGGVAKTKADISLHVEKNNYGIVEDAHQALMHTMAQYIRRKHLEVSADTVKF